MSAENIETAKRVIETMNERDLDGLLAVCDPEVEFHALTQWPGEPTELYGHEGAEYVLEVMGREFAENRSEPREFIDAGERVVALVELSAIGRQSGVPVRMDEALVFTINEGLLVRLDVCGTRQKALEKAGLSE
ncbi:MAG: nuclear transport factor 2 family protein [Solirubrobacterales bacterium]